MNGPIDHSVTLEDVFTVVNTKRVPLAPELAGYLTLEIAEGAQAQSGDVEPRCVFIGEEGTVALVRSKDVPGDAEASVRRLLLRLLDASGSQTPALGAAARRKTAAGIPGLVEELEAALIPVNRAAGRRALARLAREVKRVTAGVGRNAPPPERPPLPPRPPSAITAQSGPPPSAPSAPAPSVAPHLPSQSPSQGSATAALAGAVAPSPALHAPPPPPPPPSRPPPAPARLTVPPAAMHPAVAPATALAQNATSSPPTRSTAQSSSDAENALPGPPTGPPVPPPAPSLSGASSSRSAPPSSSPEAELLRRALPSKSSMSDGDAVDQLLANFEVSGATTDRAVSRELKAMVGLDPTPRAPSTSSGPDDVERLLAMTDRSIPIANVRRPGTVPLGVFPPSPSSAAPAPSPPAPLRPPASLTQPIPLAAELAPASPPLGAAQAPFEQVEPLNLPARAAPIMPSGAAAPPRTGSRFAKTVVVPQRRKGRIDRILIVLTLVVLAGGAAAIWQLKPGFFSGRTPEKIDEERRAAAAAASQEQQASAAQHAARCRAVLEIVDVPASAEVLMRVGQAPVDIERMPVGARLEFVATAEGFAPKRSIIPAGAGWDSGPEGKPRFELAVQLDPTRARPGSVDPWPAGEPGSVVGGRGAPGTVHVVSTPRAAEMWLLVGAGPEALIDPVKCDQDIEILIAGPTVYRKRLKTSAAQIAQAPLGQTGAHLVKISAAGK